MTYIWAWHHHATPAEVLHCLVYADSAKVFKNSYNSAFKVYPPVLSVPYRVSMVPCFSGGSAPGPRLHHHHHRLRPALLLQQVVPCALTPSSGLLRTPLKLRESLFQAL